MSSSLQTQQQIMHFLETTSNDYVRFILKKIQENPNSYGVFERKAGYELHHIVPTYANGPDIPGNMILLTIEDHAKAHYLLYQFYGNHYDLCAYLMRVGKTKEAIIAMQKANFEKMKREKLGRFNSENQRKCGQKNKGVRKKAHVKNCFVAAALKRGMIWAHEDSKVVEISPGSCQGMTEVVNMLLFGFSEKQKQNFREKQSKSYIYSGILKLISGHRDLKTKKCIFRVGPWRLVGVFI